MYMRLTTDTDTNHHDRRLSPRHTASGHVQGVRLDFSPAACRAPNIDLRMQDFSEGGLCGTSDAPLEPGEHLNLFFGPFGTMPGRNRRGRVVRCTPTEDGYTVAVAFERMAMAA